MQTAVTIDLKGEELLLLPPQDAAIRCDKSMVEAAGRSSGIAFLCFVSVTVVNNSISPLCWRVHLSL